MNHSLKKFATSLALMSLILVALSGCGSGDSVSPDQAIANALDKTAELKSGAAKLDGSISLGSLPGSIAITGDSSFDTEAADSGAVNINLAIEIAGTKQEFGFTSVDGKNYIIVGDKAAAQKEGDSNLSADSIASMIGSIGDHISGAKSTGENTYTAKLDTKALFESASESGGKGLKGLQVPGFGSVDDLAKNLGVADLTVEVAQAGYAEKISLDMPLSLGGGEGGLRFNITLEDVGQPQTISAPKNLVDDPRELGLSFGGE